ncbi:unnamed protein product [Diamesa tonsa]
MKLLKTPLVAIFVCAVNGQFFGQSFSSSSVSGPGGVVSQSVYTDSNGNRVVNGVNSPSSSLSLPKPVSNPAPSRPVASKPVVSRPVASRPVASGGDSAGAYKPDNSGAYKPDNSGVYKPSG